MSMKVSTAAVQVLGMVFNHWKELVNLIKKFLDKNLSGMGAHVEKRQSSKQNLSRLVIGLVSKFNFQKISALQWRKTVSNASMRVLVKEYHNMNTINVHSLAKNQFKFKKFVDTLIKVSRDLKEPADNFTYLKNRARAVKLALLMGT